MPKQSVPIELDGKTRHIRYTFNSLIALEEELGIPISDIESKLTGSVKLKDLRSLLWAGLLHEDKSITPEDAGELVGDASNITEVANKITEAFESAFPDTEDVKKKPNSTVPKSNQKDQKTGTSETTSNEAMK